MGTVIHTREYQTLTDRVMKGRGYSKPADSSFYVGLLTTGLSLTAASTASNAASGEVASSNGYARQLFGVTISSITSNTITTSYAHNKVNDNRIHLITTNTLPTGTALATEYFVIGATSTTLQISATQGGSAVTITGSGTGTHYIKASPVYDTGGDNRAEAIDDTVQFTASGGDIVYQGYFLMCNTTSTRGDSSGSTLVFYEYFGASQTITNGETRAFRIRTYVSDRGNAVGSTT
jgi:hypothetical protein